MKTVAERLAYVRDQTRCPDKAAFARWIGAKSAQAAGNWETRNRLPAAAANLIHEQTGASRDWLIFGAGEPFPGGAKPFPGAMPQSIDDRLRFVEDFAGQVQIALTHLIQSVSAKIPGAGKSLAEVYELEARSWHGSTARFLEAAAAAAEQARSPKAVASHAGPPQSTSGSRGRK